jgi:cobaltochelatase CobS
MHKFYKEKNVAMAHNQTIAKFATPCPACGKDFIPERSVIVTDPNLFNAFIHDSCRGKGYDRKFKSEWGNVINMSGKSLRVYAENNGVAAFYSSGSSFSGRRLKSDMRLRYELASLAASGSERKAVTKLEDLKLQFDLEASNIDYGTHKATPKVENLEVIDTKALVMEILEKLDHPLDTKIDDKFNTSRSELRSIIKNGIDQVRNEVGKVMKHEHHIYNGKAKPVVLKGRMHKCFEDLLLMTSADVNVWICGPAGSGKTTAAQQVAKALGLNYYFNGAIDSEYKLSGFVDAHGNIVSTAFREAYTHGGLYLFDEVDASLPSAVLAFNAALAGDFADFPGETDPTPRHKDFRCIAAANTWGYGGGTDYVGRSKMDAAFLDRFVQLDFPYDEDLEATFSDNHDWVVTVQTFRRRAAEKGLKVIISPRATIKGTALLAAGMPKAKVLEAVIFAKLSKENRLSLNDGYDLRVDSVIK